MSDADQCALVTNEEAPSLDKVGDVLIWVLSKHEQPSAWDLVSIIERELGWKSRVARSGLGEKRTAMSFSGQGHRLTIGRIVGSKPGPLHLRGRSRKRKITCDGNLH